MVIISGVPIFRIFTVHRLCKMRRGTFVRFQQLLDTMFVDRRGRICTVSRHGQPNTEEGHSGCTWVLNCLNLQVIIIQIHTKGILVVHEN